MLPNLKLQIFRRGSQQNLLAKAVGIDETVLSKIIRGSRTPTLVQRRVLAKYLEADEAWLFENLEFRAMDFAHGHSGSVRRIRKLAPLCNEIGKSGAHS